MKIGIRGRVYGSCNIEIPQVLTDPGFCDECDIGYGGLVITIRPGTHALWINQTGLICPEV